MANIGNKGLEIPAQKRGLKRGNTQQEVSESAQTSVLNPEQKFNLLLGLIIGVCIVLLVTCFALLADFWQFADNSFKENTRVVNEYNNKRYTDLENRVINLEQNKTTSIPKLKK